MENETKFLYNQDGQVNKELAAIIDGEFEEDINKLVKNVAKHVADEGYDRYHLLKYLENSIEFEVVSEIHNRSK
jgi:hypothetical protein